MNVGLDYWPGSVHEPGRGRYLREVVAALARIEDGPRLRLVDWGPGARLAMQPEESDRLTLRRVLLPRSWLVRAARSELGARALARGCDLVHGCDLRALTGRRAPAVVAVSEWPQESRDLASAAGIVAFSEHAARRLRDEAGVVPERVHVIPVGCEHFARGMPPPSRDPRRPVALALGRIDHARAPLAILAACERLRDEGVAVELEFLGQRGDAYDELRARVTRSRICAFVRFDSAPTDALVRAALARASALVHLSDGELTPVTPLEALACGVSVVATRAPAFVEALGEHAIWVEPPVDDVQPEALALAIASALSCASDPAAAERRIRHAARYSWAAHAALTLRAWREILARA